MQGELGEIAETAPGEALGDTDAVAAGGVGAPRDTGHEGPAPQRHLPLDGAVRTLIIALEYAIVASLLVVAGIVLVLTVKRFVTSTGGFPNSVVPAVDGILAVIILLDIVHTVFRHLRGAEFPVRPFLVVGILAAVRGILSASAHLTLATHLSVRDFEENIIELAVSVGAVLALLAGLFVLDHRRRVADVDDPAT